MDVLALAEHDAHPGEAFIRPVMRAGCRMEPPAPLMALRQRALAGYTHLPQALRGLDNGAAYRVAVSSALQELAGKVDRGAP